MPAQTLRTLRKLAALSRREWTDLLSAQLALIQTEWRVKRAPVGGLAVRDASAGSAPAGDAARARELARAVARAADHGVFRPYCLVRALTLQGMLRANGVQGSAVRVGVRRANGKFAAHAWVVWREEILGDVPEHVAQFEEVDDLRVVADMP